MHGYLCQSTILVYGECHCFCNLIAIRSGDFYQFVSAASNQLAIDDMCFCAGCPSIDFGFNRFTLFVFGYFVQFQFCTSQFIRTSHCLFADGYLCDIVLHGNFGYLSGFVYGKLHIFRICITIRSIFFMERIFLTCNQLANDFMRLVSRCPFFYDFIFFVLDLERCSWDFLVASDVLLADGYLGGIIFHHDNAASIYIFAIFVLYCHLASFINCKGHSFCQYIAVRSGFFCQCVCASIELNLLRCLL